MWQARAARIAWRRDGVPMEARKPRLLQALNALYAAKPAETAQHAEQAQSGAAAIVGGSLPLNAAPRVPWLNAPEDSWL